MSAEHPFKGTPQHDQQYDNHGPGRPGNGLGNVWGVLADDDWDTWEGSRHYRERPSSKPQRPGHVDAHFVEPAASDGVGLPEILLALETLTERQRFVIECRYGLRPGMDGQRLSVRDIASLMGISHPTVVQHEREGLERLRERIGAITTPPSH